MSTARSKIMHLPKIDLPGNQVHLWAAHPEQITDPHLIHHYHRLLEPGEQTKQRRFHFEKHRHAYLITRAAVRTLLSRYTGLPATDLRFEENEYGRPHLRPDCNPENLHFNISHTDGLIVVAVVRNREIGVDVEYIQRGGDLINIADRYFSEQEVKDLHKLPDREHIDRFFDYWTLKESYIKARGMGLSIPLGQFTFHLDGNPPIHISVDPAQNDPPGKWQFRQWRVDERFKIALALEREPGKVFDAVLRETVPLSADRPYQPQPLRDGFDKEPVT
jgi:4'-phosphopantetheinyl transferase